jgi:photosystem II stability/assembly factor-like uncharacterized protein
MKKIILIFLFIPSVFYSQWVEQQVPSSIGILLSIDFVNSTTGVSTGWVLTDEAYGRALYTTNSGINWLYAIIPDSSRSLVTTQMLNSTTGYSAGACNIFSAQTMPMPVSWLNYSKSKPIVVNSIGRCDSLIGTRGFFLKTTNSGHSWFPYGGFPQNVYYLVGMHFINLTTGYVSAQTVYNTLGSDAVYRTTNGGINWALCYSDTSTADIRNIYFVNSNTGIAVGYAIVYNTAYHVQGMVLRTTNGGNNWSRQLFYYVNNFTDVTMVNSSTGYASGVCNSDTLFRGIIYKTTNSGQNWFKLSFQLDTAIFEGIEFYPSSGIGICYGEEFYADSLFPGTYMPENTVILKTSDYGNTWQTFLARDPDDVNVGSKMLSLTNWYISGGDLLNSDARILHTTNGGAIGIQPVSNEIPNKFSLSQNYPNPFNPKSNIKFQIAKSGDVKLVIFDVLGREVTTLVNEKLSPGTYEVTWDGSSYPSGVYFYELITQDYSQTKRMVLIK